MYVSAVFIQMVRCIMSCECKYEYNGCNLSSGECLHAVPWCGRDFGACRPGLADCDSNVKVLFARTASFSCNA